LLPIVLSESVRTGLVGEGDLLGRRASLLVDAGIKAELLSDPEDEDLAGLKFLFVAGLPDTKAYALAARARALGVLVNVEDMPELCDFHVPAVVRRGDLVLTASTGGRAPGLARHVREWLEDKFGPEWQGRLNEIGKAREGWRADGIAPTEVSRRTREWIGREGWLP
jgi:precorrin-2 dehydrogenase/sirohydrochlorin ferrochelatase